MAGKKVLGNYLTSTLNMYSVGPEASGDLTQRYLFVSKSYFMMAVRGDEIRKG